ncbi:hypothetical protein BDV29DRAFT_170799 [Aspergillus leporis]|uniref:Uncharacterized protein n=1 Tax=Aspergillus leporis TaxID=41062 RepID=A0A5N5X5T5_9EURO|nr:hypothetical protein BDV29DRAFT_170799 [Aspergillus leporis]
MRHPARPMGSDDNSDASTDVPDVFSDDSSDSASEHSGDDSSDASDHDSILDDEEGQELPAEHSKRLNVWMSRSFDRNTTALGLRISWLRHGIVGPVRSGCFLIQHWREPVSPGSAAMEGMTPSNALAGFLTLRRRSVS